MSTNSVDKSRPNLVGELWWTLFPATITVTIANVLFYYFVTQILGFELLVPSESRTLGTVPLPVFDVILFSILWAVAAGVVFLVVIALSQNPIPIYVAISSIVLFLSFGLPLMMPANKVLAETKGTFIAWHIIGAVIVVGILVALYRRRLSVQ